MKSIHLGCTCIPILGISLRPDVTRPMKTILAKDQIRAIHVKDAMPCVIREIPFEQGNVPFRETFRVRRKRAFGACWASRFGDKCTLRAARIPSLRLRPRVDS